jgi:DNA-binding winged helix-turn-helix (wHTH) protein/tetratricopeptide (TPR) repeat protein
MPEVTKASGSIRFGPFELSRDTHELSKHGTRLKLWGQAIQVLELLTARAGQVVTREELQQKLWPSVAFGDPEHGLNAAVNRLRDSLADSAIKPIYIETVPGRGYRFIAEVHSANGEKEDKPPIAWRRLLVVIVSMGVVAAIATWLIFHHKPILPERGWVLITDFDARGDNPLADDLVREGLTISLQQSRYVNVFSRAQVREILALMGKANVMRIDEDTGREICQRANLQVLITGSIENLGKVLQITVRAVEPVKGTLFFAEEEHFKNEEFFEKVDALAIQVRKDLGESVKGIKANSRPLAKVTTRDLQALQLYSQAADAKSQGRVEEVLALLVRALTRDPEFAMAHRKIAQIYEIMGNRAQELEHLKRAYDLRDRLTDREGLLIEADYDQFVGRKDEAVNVLTELVARYPEDPEAHNDLAFAYNDMGNLENSIQELYKVIKIDPNSAPSYASLAVQLSRNNAPEMALNIYQEAKRRGLALPGAGWGKGLALWNQGRVAEAQAEFQSLQTPGSLYASIGRIYFARTLIYQGKLAAASAQLTVGIIEDRAANNMTPELLERYLLAAVRLTQGNKAQARRQLQLIVAAVEDPALQTVDLFRAGSLYAQMGDVASGREILRKLEDLQARQATPFNRACRYDLAGEIALAEARNTDAKQLFLAALAAYPLALSHQGLARAYQAQQDWPSAAKEWEKFLNSRGEVFQDHCPADWVLAHVFLARVRRRLNDIDGSGAEYTKFFEIWRESDQSSFVQSVYHESQQETNAGRQL